MSKPIALIDCNSFYASSKRPFLQQIGRAPVVILSNHYDCAIARSNEENELGIEMDPLWHLDKIL
jgi:DNA polymerase V